MHKRQALISGLVAILVTLVGRRWLNVSGEYVDFRTGDTIHMHSLLVGVLPSTLSRPDLLPPVRPKRTPTRLPSHKLEKF